jgi:KipI family sensor histidine kinase inhibitor
VVGRVGRGVAVTQIAMGDAALMLRWTGLGRAGDPLFIAAAYRAIRGARIPGVLDVVPAAASVLVRFDPKRTSGAELRSRLPGSRAFRAGLRPPRKHKIRVRYGGGDGPDLEEVAARLGLTADQVVSRHAAAVYTVLATGFSPGFVYLGPLPASLILPRRDDPRVAVPSGSVALADAQTGVYGARTGGGWWLIGRATAATFRPDKRPPIPFEMGDSVEFEVQT